MGTTVRDLTLVLPAIYAWFAGRRPDIEI